MRKRFLYLLMSAFTISMLSGFVLEEKKDNKPMRAAKIDHCYSCHKEIGSLPKDFGENDVHRYANLTCASCHGGDPNSEDQDAAMNPAKGFVGAPSKKDIPNFCGKCHSNINFMRTYQPKIPTDQVSQYLTSMHGKKLIEGNQDVAECASCHTAHNIIAVKDPRSTVYKFNIPNTCNKCHGDKELMKKYGLKANQLEEYSKSVHGEAVLKKKDLGAPVCNDCHGNHGAMPPGVTSISYVCGVCHASNMEYYNSSGMAKIFQEQNIHGCEQCHSNHLVLKPNDEMIGVGKDSKCTECHSAGDAGYATSKKIYSLISNFKNQYASTESKYNEVKEKGMNDIDIGFLLQDAKQNLIQSRTMIHTFDSTKVGNKINEGMDIVNKASLMAQNQIDEYYSRRNGFAAATAVFFLIIIALYFKIKDREKKNKNI